MAIEIIDVNYDARWHGVNYLALGEDVHPFSCLVPSEDLNLKVGDAAIAAFKTRFEDVRRATEEVLGRETVGRLGTEIIIIRLT